MLAGRWDLRKQSRELVRRPTTTATTTTAVPSWPVNESRGASSFNSRANIAKSASDKSRSRLLKSVSQLNCDDNEDDLRRRRRQKGDSSACERASGAKVKEGHLSVLVKSGAREVAHAEKISSIARAQQRRLLRRRRRRRRKRKRKREGSLQAWSPAEQ